ncbi:MAG: hypothetical protein IRY86_12405, partial [Thermorudis peleae]|nr:hypothetical protein [Thermorudis peleae]
MESTGDGGLVLRPASGPPLQVAPPQAFQPRADGGRDPIPASYWVAGQRYGVQLRGPVDPARPVVIDPLVAATFVGGTGVDSTRLGRRVSRLPDGRLVVAGYTQSPTFPGAGGPRPGGPGDAVLVALDPGLTTISWATYLGGSGDDVARSVDATSGDVFVVGSTTSFSDFPGMLIGPGGGSEDAFIARLTASGALQWARRIGGAANVYGEDFWGVQVANGAVYAVGSTDSDWQAANIPNGAYDTSFDRSGNTPPLGAAVIARFDLDGTLTAWTYNSVPGNVSYAYDLVVWDNGLAVVGNACGVHTTTGAFQTSCQGGPSGGYGDGWLAVFSLDLQTLQYGTFLGSPGSDIAVQVVRQAATGLLWILGSTDSASFPTTVNRLQACGNGIYDAFLVAIAPNGNGASDLRYGTCLGSTGDDTGQALSGEGAALALVATVQRSVSSGWTPAGRAFFDETYNGPSGTRNDYLALLELSGGANPTVTVRAWSYFGSDRDLPVYASGLVLWTDAAGYRLVRETFQDGQLLDGLPRNLPVGPAGVVQPQPAGDADIVLAEWIAADSNWQVPPARASSAQLTVVGQGTVRSSVWDWDGPTPLRFNQAGPGTQSITTASQRPFRNQLVWLAATPSPGWTFQGWSGDCTGTTPMIQVTVGTTLTCTATFVPTTPSTPTPTPTPVPKPDLVVRTLDARPRAARGG